MLSELLDYSKPVSLQLRKLSALAVADRSLEAVETVASPVGIKLKHNLTDPNDFGVFADEDLLIRLLTNLLLNAVQASNSETEVSLGFTRNPDGSVDIEVADQGRGMNGRIRERLFDPFFTTREEGTGLGMSNVKKIVESHGGKIEIESVEGAGTVVRVHLPGDRADG